MKLFTIKKLSRGKLLNFELHLDLRFIENIHIPYTTSHDDTKFKGILRYSGVACGNMAIKRLITYRKPYGLYWKIIED